MCLICFLSTDREIKEIPFDENDPKFYITRADERPSCFTKNFIYSCGSHLGCGCGFGYMKVTEELLKQTEQDLLIGNLSYETEMQWWKLDVPPPQTMDEFQEDAREIRDAHKDNNDLCRLIEETVNAGYFCQLMICWAGHQNHQIQQHVMIDIERKKIEIDFETIKNIGTNEILFYSIHSSQNKTPQL
jgi:hypothetical protein